VSYSGAECDLGNPSRRNTFSRLTARAVFHLADTHVQIREFLQSTYGARVFGGTNCGTAWEGRKRATAANLLRRGLAPQKKTKSCGEQIGRYTLSHRWFVA
jgi:hypothetical protein